MSDTKELGRLVAPVLLILAGLGATTLAGNEAGLVVRRSPVTGLATSVTAADGGVIWTDTAKSRSKGRPGDFLEAHGRLFGIVDADGQLRLQRTRQCRLGQTHTTYSQMHLGIPVFSGVVKVHQDAAGQVVAANGDFYPIPAGFEVEPTLDAGAAARAALASVVAVDPKVLVNRIVIVDPGWYGDRPLGPRLAYQIVVSDQASFFEENIFIDAHSGAVLDRWNLILGDRERVIHNGMGTQSLPGPVARVEGQAPLEPAGDPVIDDINRAYDNAGDVYGYYWHAFGRDSIDNAGLPLRMTVNSTAIEAFASCPSAFWHWSALQIVHCLGRVPDDNVAHEFTHGLTYFASGLIHQNQSGMLNESFSFVFGETIDLFNSGSEVAGVVRGAPSWAQHPTDTGFDEPNNRRTGCSFEPELADGVRWLYNEDYEAWYDMWEPSCYSMPDRAGSPLLDCRINNQGGTHIGANVPNHAYAMLTDGKTFNGITVNGIGLIKSAAVWYRALTTYLTEAADFEDAYWALNQAAADLVGTAPNDPRSGEPSEIFTAADAIEVDKALRAAEMNTPGRCGETAGILDSAIPRTCSGKMVFFDGDFEGGLGGWRVSGTGNVPARPWLITSRGEDLPFLRPGRVAYAAIVENNCEGGDGSGASRLDSPAIQLPEELNFPILEFTHYISTQAVRDGGNVKLRVDGGAWQLIPATSFFFNGYSTTLAGAQQGNTNPLGGQQAFSNQSGNWGTSLVHLGSLVSGGESIEMRFELGVDWCVGGGGWFIDDVRVTDCTRALDCDGNAMPDELQLTAGHSPEIVVSHPSGHSSASYSDGDRLADERLLTAAQRFSIFVAKRVRELTIWGVYFPGNGAPFDEFTVVFHEHDAADGLPGAVLAPQQSVVATQEQTGHRAYDCDEWRIEIELPEPVTLEPGTYWVEIFNNTAGSDDGFAWIHSTFSQGEANSARAEEVPGRFWSEEGTYNRSIEIKAESIGADCNRNGTLDSCEIAQGLASDDDGNGIPDRCQPGPPRRVTGRRGLVQPTPTEPLGDTCHSIYFGGSDPIEAATGR